MQDETSQDPSDDGLLDVVVVGGGQAGLAMAWHLRHQDLRFVVLEAGGEIGHVWRSRWDSLSLFTPTQYNALPGMPFPAQADTYPTKDPVADYLQAYTDAFDLPVRLNARVNHLSRTEDGGYHAELVFDDGLIREIPDRKLRPLAKADVKGAVAEAIDLYMDAARSLCETGRCRVLICARPDELQDDPMPPRPADEESVEEPTEHQQAQEPAEDFHDQLKARALTLSCPLQLIRRETWEGTVKDRPRKRPLQDEATRAWNLHTALYYKAGGTPWRLPRHHTDLASCYVGVSFYRTPDRSELHTAVAQVFNERGDGVVVRGGAAKISKADRQPHLNQQDARRLLTDALAEYRRTHGHPPARIVLHKTSNFDDQEVEGFRGAADDREIDFIELIWVQRRAAPRLFRSGQLPPLRGTTLQLEPDAMIVYTGLRGVLPDLPRHVRPASAAPTTRGQYHRTRQGGDRGSGALKNELEQCPAR